MVDQSPNRDSDDEEYRLAERENGMHLVTGLEIHGQVHLGIGLVIHG